MARAMAKRHAQAIFNIALEKNELEQWRSDLKKLGQVLAEPRLRPLWENPRVRLGEKLEALRGFMEGANPLALNLAGLLISRGRLGLIDGIVAEYERFVDAHYGIEHAEVTTAIPLDEATKQELARRLGQALGKKVMVEARVDASVIGGMVARVGDLLLDGSVRTRLEGLRRSLSSR